LTATPLGGSLAKIRFTLWFLLFVAMVVLQPSRVHAQNSLQFGKWILRAPSPASGTREYEDRGCGLIVSNRQGVTADGKTYYSQYAAKVDGKQYPRLVKGSKTVGTIQWNPIDKYSNRYTLREDGQITSTGVTTVSADGRVLTVTSHSSSGRTGTEIYDRASN